MTIELATKKLTSDLKKMFADNEISVRENQEGLFDIVIYKSTQYTLNVFSKTGIISISNHKTHINLDKKDFYQICLM